MDWDRAIARNTAALETILGTLLALLGLSGEADRPRISRGLHAKALRILRPAEAALRRLIVIAARGLVTKPAPKSPGPKGPIPKAKGEGRATFRLFDPRKRFFAKPRADFGPKYQPRIHVFGSGIPLAPLSQPVSRAPVPPPPAPDDRINAVPLRRRLAALEAALSDIPHQARRLARWQAKRRQLRRPVFTEPLRPGRPPGYRRTPIHEVDHVLAECHGLARDLLRADTS